MLCCSDSNNNVKYTDFAYYTHAAVVMRSVASVCLSVCPVRALTFESIDLEASVLVCRYTRASSYVKVIWSRSRLQEQNMIYTRN